MGYDKDIESDLDVCHSKDYMRPHKKRSRKFISTKGKPSTPHEADVLCTHLFNWNGKTRFFWRRRLMVNYTLFQVETDVDEVSKNVYAR